ncbi:MAG: amino acid ABC transporter permease [Firmicutes bacterium]|nr:amino acid ABC transporter permease [Bacillota bacterium]
MPDSFFGRVFFLLQNYWESYLRGAGNTLLIAIVATFIGVIIGLIVGIIMTIPKELNENPIKTGFLWIVKKILFCYIELFRGTPMMVQAMVIYYGLIQYFNITMSMLGAGFFVVSINTGAYMAETVRGGILSIDKGQTEGAKSIGMSHFQTMLYVIMPQALRNIMPQIGNNLIINIKDTSVLSVISVTELFFATKTVMGVYYTAFEAYFIACIIYLFMTVTCARILRRLEKRMEGSDSYDLATKDTLAHTSGMTGYIEKEDK